MKKRIYIFIAFIIFVIISAFFVKNKSSSYAINDSEEPTETQNDVIPTEERVIGAYGTYDKATRIIQEVMRDYYIKEEKFQYNYSRAQYGTNSPEEATSQDNKYLVCAAYTYSCYVEAFGVYSKEDGFPIYNYSISDAAASYYDINKEDFDKLDGNYLIYYEKKADNIKYIYNNITDKNEFAQMIRPGDLFVFTGHAMIAYKTVERTPGNWDVLMLNSTGGSSLRTRSTGTSKIFYNISSSSHGVQDVIYVEPQGTVQYFWLSESSHFFNKNGILSCSNAECAVVRPFYEGTNGEAIFNYSILPSKYQKSELRLQYPGLYIEKTVDKVDNNSVYLNDVLEYTVKIINRSNTTGTGTNWATFYVTEDIGKYVEYVSSDGELLDNKVIFTVNGLDAGNSIQLKYKVRVKQDYDNINNEIIASGAFKANLDDIVSISTGNVTNIIVPSITENEIPYKDCYNELKDSKKGLELINDIYVCALSRDFHFDTFQLENLLSKSIIKTKGATNAIVFKKNLNDNYTTFKNMILNNIWGGISIYREGGVLPEGEIEEYVIPRWSGTVSSLRARNIQPGFFKNGDVLIYSIDYSKTDTSLIHTKEDGIYAYIYLDGRFIGVNGTDTTIRNEFTYNYYSDNSISLATHLYSGYNNLTGEYDIDGILTYLNYETLFDKDYYVVFRPELVIKQEAIITIENEPIKKDYYQGEELNLDGLKVVLRYNDGDSRNLLMNEISVSGFNKDIVGPQVLTISYNGKSTKYIVNVNEKYFTVTFNSDGGSTVESQTVEYNATATKPSNPTKTGYTFKKWLLNDIEYNFNVPVTGNITLTAEWDINEYTVTFNSDGGSTVESQIVEYNATATKPSNPTKQGYVFRKWLLNGAEYDFNTSVTKNITLKASWEKVEEYSSTDSKSTINTLSDLKINGVTISEFSSSKTLYTLTDSYDSSITISAELTDSNATISGIGEKDLNYGINSFEIIVVAENGDERKYTISINRLDNRSDNKNLKALTIDPGNIDFDKDNIYYLVNVEHDVNEINISATADDSRATISGIGKKVLQDYINEFKIEVKAENETIKIYTIKVVREDSNGNTGELSADNTVKSISIKNNNFNFNKNKKKYDISVDNDTNEVEFEVIPNDSKAIVSIQNNTNLKVGLNTVSVKIISETGVANEYLFNVYRKEEKQTKGFNSLPIIVIIGILIIVLIILKLMQRKEEKNDKEETLNNTSNNF